MRFGAKLIFMLCLLLLSGRSSAQDSPPSEYQVKAAFLFNFARFVEWPAGAFTNARAPIIIGVLGDNPFGDDLEQTIRGKSINARPVISRQCQSLGEARQCHILFVSTSEKKRFKQITDGLTGSSVLTVAESGEFIADGGMINFFRDGSRIRFDINDEAAKQAGLKIDSKLLGLRKKPAN